jgi:hypothetical protein
MANTVQRSTISRYQENVQRGAISFGPKNPAKNPSLAVLASTFFTDGDALGLLLVENSRRLAGEFSLES